MSPGDASALRDAVLEAERLEGSGDAVGAIAALRRALALAPDFAPAHFQLGLLLQDRGDAASAVEHFGAAARLRPTDARASSNLAAALNYLGRFAEGAEAARAAIARDARHPWAHYHLGRAMLAQGEKAQGRRALEDAVRLEPRNASAWEWLGASWLEEGALVKARAALARATSLDPASASGWSRLAAAHLHLCEQGEAIAALARAEQLAGGDAAQVGSTRLLALHYDGDLARDAIFEAHRAWGAAYAPSRPLPAFTNSREPQRRLRVGYVSPRFHEASLRHVLAPVLRHHDRGAIEVTLYANQAIEDAATREYRAHADRWVQVAHLDDPALAQRMRDDAIDVAVDLAGHTPGHRLTAFAWHPAPVTLTWLDYFDTTGVAAIRYLVTDNGHTPTGDAQRLTEEALRLPRLRLCYAPPSGAPPVASAPARAAAAPVLGSFNRMAKVSTRTLRAWSRAMAAAHDARLVVKNSSLNFEEERAAFAARFAAAGLDPGRIDWRGYSDHAAMLDEYNAIDIVLDTFPYNGGITTFEALWMGRPVVTIRGDTMISRQSAAVLGALGLEELVAEDEDGFAAIVARLARDRHRREEIGQGLRERMRGSAVLDGAGLARALEAAFRKAWTAWLAGGRSGLS